MDKYVFDKAVEFILGPDIEGGYVNNPDDPGGETKFGISKRQYPELDIANLTIEHAREIYYQDYWKPICGDQLPEKLAFLTFNAAVNMGVDRAVRLLQKTVHAREDGEVGPQTIGMANAMRDNAAAEFCTQQVMAYVGMKHFFIFGHGWIRRTFKALYAAMETSYE